MRTPPEQPQWQPGIPLRCPSSSQKDLMPLGPLDWFPRVLFESQRALLLPRSPQRERESELLWTQNSDALCMRVLKICERFNPSLCRCGAFECRPLAQIAICGMRQLNCGSSSRFRIRLARMWVKTNRTKTESMDINTMLVYFDIRTST